MLDTVYGEGAKTEEKESAEAFQTLLRKKAVEVYQFFNVVKGAEKRKNFPVTAEPLPVLCERVKVRVKLPKLTIEKLNRDTKQYRAFRDAFDTAENESNKLTGVEKFIYQRSYLIRDALKLQIRIVLVSNRVALEILGLTENNSSLIPT